MPRRIASQDADDLVQAERDIQGRIGDRPFDFDAMSAVANIYRAASAVRNHMEQRVLDAHDLSWGAFTVLFVLWIWGDMETGHLAEEAGVTKGTLTGIVTTLEARGMVRRAPHTTDRRRVVVALSRKGRRTIETIFPTFNEHEVHVTAQLSARAKRELAHSLRVILRTVEQL